MDGVVKPDPKGRWFTGHNRTYNKCEANNTRWMFETAGDGDRQDDRLKDYYSNKYLPIKIFKNEEDDTPFLVLFPPPLLHLLLGICYLVTWYSRLNDFESSLTSVKSINCASHLVHSNFNLI